MNGFHKIGLRPVILMLAFVLSIPCASAAKNDYTVTLNSGTTFDSLRQPQVAPWDREVILVLTDAGNWIGIPRAEVQSITASIEESGLGTVIDSKTIAIGRLQEMDEDEEGEDGEGTGSSDDPFNRLDSFLERIQESSAGSERPVYNTEQFVNPGDAGRGNAGFPADYVVEP